MQGGKRWPVAVTKRFVAHHLQATDLGEVLGCSSDVGHRNPAAIRSPHAGPAWLATVSEADLEPLAEPQ